MSCNYEYLGLMAELINVGLVRGNKNLSGLTGQGTYESWTKRSQYMVIFRKLIQAGPADARSLKTSGLVHEHILEIRVNCFFRFA